MGRRAKLVATGLALLAATLVVAHVAPREPLLARFPASTAVHDRHGALLRLTLAADGRYRLPLPLERISPKIVAAVLLHEDQRFFRHPGVDGAALLRGAWRSFVVRDRRVGASTITMQLARRLHGLDTRHLPGKLVQLLRALELEARYSKREILEAYLNLVPFGGNVEGVGAASLVYFRREAAELTLAEALSLAVVPQSPARRRPRADNADLAAARARLFERWRARHDASTADAVALEAPLVTGSTRDLPFFAPHAVQALLARPAAAARTRIDTTLDLRTQRLVEHQLQAFVARQRRFGIENAAALLVDVRDRSVVASVGSADFGAAAIAGQVDGTRARRSPGSALKPFIYALAFEQGLLHPMTVLEDRPQAFGPQSPENFDGEFAGPLTAQDALVRSRNVPAVAVGLRLRAPGLHGLLRGGGVANLAEPAHYGLALYLGGAEVTMRELAALYAMLADGGIWAPLRDELPSSAQAPLPMPRRLLGEPAAWVTLEMLARNPRPAQAFANTAIRARGPVYWKTGTSNGFRDAWAAGVFDHHVLVVWIGNFDGRPNPAFVGVQVAAPLFFQLVDALRATRPAGAPDRPASMLRPPPPLRRVEVCAGSGDLPNAWCPRRVETWYLPGVSPIRVSTLHRALRIDRRSGLQACADAPAAATRIEVFESWSSDMLELFERAGLPRRRPPPLDPSCAGALAEAADIGPARAPEISSPLDGVAYLLRDADAAQPATPLALRASADAEIDALYWFVDGAFVGRAARGQGLEWLPRAPGRYQLRVVDDAGRAARREVVVARAP
ncbi:MAG: penicillin-binding protein 1C [Gammaproteobacteria bacterium]|nr:penicillin-binding protein 1C [Gammaproteobacteria bacterium]